jgi:hypothetical protein
MKSVSNVIAFPRKPPRLTIADDYWVVHVPLANFRAKEQRPCVTKLKLMMQILEPQP